MQTEIDPTVGFLKEVHSDARRTIREWNAPEHGISYTDFDVHAAIPLGNHFHAKKDETFHITAGGGVVVLQDMVPRTGEPVGERRVVPLKAGCMVFVKAFTAHTFILEPGSKMTCHSTRHYDEANNDMTAVALVPPADAASLLASTPRL